MSDLPLTSGHPYSYIVHTSIVVPQVGAYCTSPIVVSVVLLASLQDAFRMYTDAALSTRRRD